MENNEDSCNSLPFIDDVPTDDETNLNQYNLRIIENYHNKNRNIEITNRFPNEVDSLSPVAPLADETEFSDNKLNDSAENACKHVRRVMCNKESGMKLVIKGWNSSISIQGLDNKSSITFRRRCEKMHKKVERREEKSKVVCEESKSMEKSRKGRWKMLTRSIMLAKSARFERRGLDERYPKYVLLKNEEEEVTSVKENYPKMFIFNDDKGSKQKSKPEFSLKKSFKNKTEPIAPLEEILAKREEIKNTKPTNTMKKQKKPLTERSMTLKKKMVAERRKSLTEGPSLHETKHAGQTLSHGQVYNEIQGIFEDTLKLLPQDVETQQSDDLQQQPQRFEYYTSLPPQFCQFSCHDPYCCLPPHNQPPKYIPVYPSHKPHIYKHSDTQTNHEMVAEVQNTAEEAEVDLANLPFGILSSFFPRVVIMNTIPNEELRGDEEISNATNETEFKNYQLPPSDRMKNLEEDAKTTESLEVPQPDLTLKSKMVREFVKPEAVIEDFYLGDVSLKEFPSFGDEAKAKSQDSEATEYLQYTEFDPPGNEAVDRPTPPTPPPFNGFKLNDKTPPPVADKTKVEGDVEESPENLSLTKIGYKMYDNLTKLSLNREKEITKMAEVSGCGCNGNGTKKSPYNITLESNNSVVKVTVPENELNFQIVNSEEGDIQIGVMRSARGDDREREKQQKQKKIVRREELWHPDDDRRALVLRKEETREDDNSNKKGVQKLKVSLADDKDVVLSIEMNEKEKKEEKPKEKLTKEMKVGTDDLDVAGGDFVCALGGNYKNLSPRLGQLLKHLHDKLETDKKERKFLDEKINQKLIDQKYQPGPLPGVFLVKHISPRTPAPKKPAEISLGKPKKETEVPSGGLREYYCEECLATMRIFEDENPSVKSMVDKFETIIQLESF